MSELPAEIAEKAKLQQFNCYGCKKLHVSAHKRQVPSSAPLAPCRTCSYCSMREKRCKCAANTSRMGMAVEFATGATPWPRNCLSRRRRRAIVLPLQPQADPTPPIPKRNFHPQTNVLSRGVLLHECGSIHGNTAYASENDAAGRHQAAAPHTTSGRPPSLGWTTH